MIKQHLQDEAHTIKLGAKLAQYITSPLILFLKGDLGAGKTTLTRALLHALGYNGVVKSPTYTVVESYDFNGMQINHFDWYRINAAEELEFIGIWDYLSSDALNIIEWPEKAATELGIKADVSIELTWQQEGRLCEVLSHSDKGQVLIGDLEKELNH